MELRVRFLVLLRRIAGPLLSASGPLTRSRRRRELRLTAAPPYMKFHPATRSPELSRPPGGTAIHGAASASREGGFLVMPNRYHIRLDSGAVVAFDSPQAIRKSLEVHWPAGRYEICEGEATDLARGRV